MKFSLTSLLLVVGLASVCSGWFADRRRMAAEISKLESNSQFLSHRVHSSTHARTYFDVAREVAGETASSPELKDFGRTKLIFAIILMHGAKADFESFSGTQAQKGIQYALHELECHSPEQFRVLALSLDEFRNGHYPELSDNYPDEFQSFDEFLSDALTD